MHHDDELEKRTGIFLFDNLISERICDELVYEFKKDPTQHKPGEVGMGVVDTKIKITKDWVVPENLLKRLQIYDTIIWNEVGVKYPIIKDLELLKKGETKILHYKKGIGQFAPHIDYSLANEKQVRFLAVIAYLNDVKVGGETYFEYQDVRVEAKKGRVIAFPATWKYMHEGVQPLTGDKYSMVYFLTYFRD